MAQLKNKRPKYFSRNFIKMFGGWQINMWTCSMILIIREINAKQNIFNNPALLVKIYNGATLLFKNSLPI